MPISHGGASPGQTRAIVREELAPLKEDVPGLKEDVRTNRMLLRAMARAILPEDVMAEVDEGFLRDDIPALRVAHEGD